MNAGRVDLEFANYYINVGSHEFETHLSNLSKKFTKIGFLTLNFLSMSHSYGLNPFWQEHGLKGPVLQGGPEFFHPFSIFKKKFKFFHLKISNSRVTPPSYP